MRLLTRLPLPPALTGERFEFDGISCYTAGQGAPLLLVHSVNAAASAAEVAPIYERYRATRTVFAIDLPGYGFSDRSDRAYTPRLMTDALHAVRAQISKRCGMVPANAPVDALAVSLGCEFLARAAVEQPTQWGRLALVSPTGFRGQQPARGAPGSTRAMPWLHRIVSAPLWSQALFNGLTKPGVVRYFLNRTWGSRNIDEAMWAYAVKTAAQPGARHAPLHFLSGSLFSRDAFNLYEALTQPVWMCHGVRGDFTDYRAQHLLAGRRNWRMTELQTGALPYFEVPGPFFSGLDMLLATALGTAFATSFATTAT
jgi:pimeloyl-ACP methyl ester carboxylesterase